MTLEECKLDILRQFQANEHMEQFTISLESYPEEYLEKLALFLQIHVVLKQTDILRHPN